MEMELGSFVPAADPSATLLRPGLIAFHEGWKEFGIIMEVRAKFVIVTTFNGQEDAFDRDNLYVPVKDSIVDKAAPSAKRAKEEGSLQRGLVRLLGPWAKDFTAAKLLEQVKYRFDSDEEGENLNSHFQTHYMTFRNLLAARHGKPFGPVNDVMEAIIADYARLNELDPLAAPAAKLVG